MTAWLLWVGLLASPPEDGPADAVTAEEAALDDGAPAESDSVVVRARRVPPPPAGSTVVDPGEARRVAGTGGDAVVAAQSMPSVARPPAGSGQLSLWGASGSETRVLVDGVPLPALFHEGGLRAVLPPALPGALAITPAAFGPEHGHAIGGLVEVETAAPTAGDLAGEAAVDPIDASAAVEVRPHPDVALLAAGRYGWFDHVLPALAPGAEVLVPASAFRDYAARVTWERGRDATSLLLLGALDDVDRAGRATEPGVVPRERHTRRVHRLILRHTEGRAAVTAWLGLDEDARATRFGPLRAALDGETTRGGVRATTRHGGLLIGLDAEASHHRGHRVGTPSVPRREGDESVFGQAPGDDVGQDDWAVLQVTTAAFARLDVRLFDRLDVSPGLRVEPAFVRGDRRLPGRPGAVEAGYDRADFPVDPRISLELDLGGGLAARAAGGRYRQLADPADASPLYGSAALGSAVAWHGLAGLRWRGAVEVEATGFGRRAEGLAVRAVDPALGAALVDAGEGRAFGGQAGVRLPAWAGWSGAAHYTLAWSDRRDAAGAWRPFEQDQRHTLTTQLGFARGAWRVGARFRLSTGAPRPRVIGGVFDAAHGRFDPLFGAEPERLPTFHQLDLDAEYTATLGDVEVAGLATVLNATAAENVEERVYRFDYGARGGLTGVPATGLIGVRVRLK